jgi:hypothetical protein
MRFINLDEVIDPSRSEGRTMKKLSALVMAGALTIGLGACGSDNKSAPPPTGRFDYDSGTTITFTPDEQGVVDDGVEAAKHLPDKVVDEIGAAYVWEDLEPLFPYIVLATWPTHTDIRHMPTEDDNNALAVVLGEAMRFGQVDALKSACGTELNAYFASYRQ